ncbi:uncharacterized protein LOC143899128 [Temnothorax americanus]|uniref:uncharacterized protein LOC143899128 n=1 Tax=Temnothorax americanus TaxID=1964332 RepID=UPI00406876CB
MEILIQAQDTSNVDETDMSSGEKRERDKKKRREKAQKKPVFTSSSETEQEVVNVARENKENYQKQNKKEIRKNKKELPSFPQIEKFVSSTSLKEINAAESSQEIENMSDNTSSSVLAGKNVMGSCNKNKRTIATNVHDNKENLSDQEFKRRILYKLNKILFNQERFEIMLNAFDEKLQFKDNEINDECDVQFPLQSLEDLNEFEQQLQESQFKQKVLNTLRLVGGSTMHIMTSNILKKIMVNTLAKKYSWAGMKGKLVFKDLNLPKIIMQAVRLHTQYSHITDAEFADSISKWLAQAPLRTQRQLKNGQQPEEK